jgi:hypothetical protein
MAGTTHALEYPDVIWVDALANLEFRVREHDIYGVDGTTMSLNPDQWFVDTQDTYTMKVAAPYNS